MSLRENKVYYFIQNKSNFVFSKAYLNTETSMISFTQIILINLFIYLFIYFIYLYILFIYKLYLLNL